MTSIDELARIAVLPLAGGLLLGIGAASILFEIQTLVGAGIAVALLAFAVFFGAHVMLGTIGAGVVALAVAGLLGIVLELHLLRGHGIAGVVGTLALAAGVALTLGPAGALVSAEAIVIAIASAALFFRTSTRAFPRNALARKLVFNDMQGSEYVAGLDRRAYLGRSGVAASTLRPAGVVNFDGERIDAFTEGAYVGEGIPVHVTRVEGGRVFVAADAEVRA